MPASVARPRRPLARSLDLESRLPLVPLVVAQEVITEASHWLGATLPKSWTHELLFRAQGCFLHAPSFRKNLHRPGILGRDYLYRFMRHWLAACLKRDRPELFHRLPTAYASGADLPPRPAITSMPPAPVDDGWLSPDARLLAAI